MSYFIYKGHLSVGQNFDLIGEEASHLLKSRRMKVGEVIRLQDDNQMRFSCEVTEVARHSLQIIVNQELEIPAEPNFKIHLYQAMVKEKALDFILQKSAELGVAKIILFESHYSQRLPKERELPKKLERWHRILLEAAKQSDRLLPPELELVKAPVWEELEHPVLFFHLDPERKAVDIASLNEAGISLVIGPEGGFSEDEIPADSQSLTLGPRVLRADTAALAAITMLGLMKGDLQS